MAVEVILTLKAEKDFDIILEYIHKDFGLQSAVRFKNLIFHLVELLEISPEIGSLEMPEKNIRCFVVHKRLKAFYRIKSNKVIILRLFDTRQKPIKF